MVTATGMVMVTQILDVARTLMVWSMRDLFPMPTCQLKPSRAFWTPHSRVMECSERIFPLQKVMPIFLRHKFVVFVCGLEMLFPVQRARRKKMNGIGAY